MHLKFGVALVLLSMVNPVVAVNAQLRGVGDASSSRVELRGASGVSSASGGNSSSGAGSAEAASEADSRNMNETRNGDGVGCSFKYALTQTPAFLDKMWELYGPKRAGEERWEEDLRDGITAAKKGHWHEAVKCCNLSLTNNQNAHDAMLLRSVASKKLNQSLTKLSGFSNPLSRLKQ